jgi:hypothetical protein
LVFQPDLGTKSQHRNPTQYEQLPRGIGRPVSHRNFITGRIELADKDELFLSGAIFRIAAYTLGYTRDIALFSYVETGIGANFSFYSLPDAIKAVYGNHPVGGNIFVRFRLRRNT